MLTTGGVNYGYDANGNQTSRGSDTFTYDHENRLMQSVIGGVTSSSTYSGDALRMSHTIGGQTTNYTWDINAGLPVVLQDGTNTQVYGLDLISATDGGGNQGYFTYDGLGSTTDVTDGSGTLLATYAYDAFGAIRSQTGSSSNYWLFTGEQRDSDSGYYFLRARYYDPESGRFIGKDPLPGRAGAPQTQNRYAYALNGPVTLTDPSGLAPAVCSVCDALGIPQPTFSWPPPGGDAFFDWFHEYADWLYNVLIPGMHAALDAYHDFIDTIDDIRDSIGDQLDSLLQSITPECLSAAITLLAFASMFTPGIALSQALLLSALIDTAGVIAMYSVGEQDAAENNGGQAFVSAIFAIHDAFFNSDPGWQPDYVEEMGPLFRWASRGMGGLFTVRAGISCYNSLQN